jgi:serine/threonine protein kinase
MVAPVSEYPALGSLERLAHEYSFRGELDSDWAVRPLTLACREGRTMSVLEDPGGEPLDRLLGQPMELTPFLRFAVGLAAALGKLHKRGLIHKDIKPAHILVDSVNGVVDRFRYRFPSATRAPAPEPPEVIAGTLAHMAPEQTGRMNRSIDFRSDLYSGASPSTRCSRVYFRSMRPIRWSGSTAMSRGSEQEVGDWRDPIPEAVGTNGQGDRA